MWLSGFDEYGQPLAPAAVMEDIVQDYANKTVTIDAHPGLSHSMQASVHPCMHAKVMKKILDHTRRGGETVTAEIYLFIFLKFLQSVVPTIDYDFTNTNTGAWATIQR